MKGVQCYELFGGIALKIHTFSFFFIDNTAALLQPTDSHLEQQCISITMPIRQQLHMNNICFPPHSSCNAGHNASIAEGAINYLTNIFNQSIATGKIPEIWHKAIIGNDGNIGENWRPISLLWPAAKTLERVMLLKILTHIPFHPAHASCGLLSTCCLVNSVSFQNCLQLIPFCNIATSFF